MVKEKSPSTVTYSRSFQAERSINSVLIGCSRWMRDLELLLEDEWPNLIHANIDGTFADEVARTEPRLALIESSPDIDRFRHYVEAILPPSLKKVVLLKENENAFLKKTYLNYCAQCEIQVIELPENTKEAAKELSNLLLNFIGQVRSEIEIDIEKAEFIIDGFSISGNVTSLKYSKWSVRTEMVLNWLFPLVTLTTTEYRLLHLLVRAQPLFQFQTQWSESISSTLNPLLEFANMTRVKDYLQTSILLAEQLPAFGKAQKDKMESLILASKLGLLTKRALNKSLDRLIEGNTNNENLTRKAA